MTGDELTRRLERLAASAEAAANEYDRLLINDRISAGNGRTALSAELLTLSERLRDLTLELLTEPATL